MPLHTIVFILILLAAFGGVAYNAKRLLDSLRLGKWTNRFDNPIERTRRTLLIAIGQTKIFRDPVAGPVHAFIFWGFMVLLFAVLESIGEGLFGKFSFSFLGGGYSVITASQDIFIGLVILSVLAALWRRFVSKVKRLQGDKSERRDASLILYAILLIMVSLLFDNATRIALGGRYPNEVRPLAAGISHWFACNCTGVWVISKATMPVYQISWWTHIGLVLGFMNYLPYSKHLHVLTSIPNVFLSDLKKKNALKPIDFADESITKYGASDIEDLTWKQLLDGDTCTHCGRCTSVCPANITGKVLDPRWIIIQTRQRMLDKAPHLLNAQQFGFESWESEIAHARVSSTWSHLTQEDPTAALPAAGNVAGVLLGESVHLTAEEVEAKKFVGDYIPQEMLWQCTTCQACMQECPVMIEHVDEIVDLRRNLVMMEANFPPELQSAFSSMENNYSPWAFSPSERADWSHGMGVRTMAELGNDLVPVDPRIEDEEMVLFWVGCAGSFDARAKKITVAFAEVMQHAGINFRILGNEEKCTGDPARRMGNEYLAQMLIKENVETLNRYKISKIVTTCPHCFNAIKNEWGDFGGNYEVVHHTEFMLDLLAKGRIRPTKQQLETVTYHDSCYLGRSNDIYDAPRATLENIPGLEIVEMERSQSRGLCCGAGGGQMWMEEKEGKRINIERTEEAIGTGATVVASACPFCMTMLSDGVKAKDAGDHVHVKDNAEILRDSIV